MKMLGLNPMEQEIVDLTNEIARNGLIYFPEFCRIVHRRFRDEDEEVFRQNMFKVKTVKTLLLTCILSATVWHRPSARAVQGQEVQDTGALPHQAGLQAHDDESARRGETPDNTALATLILQVSEEDVEEMFTYADKDGDGKISYTEFQVMINPPKPPEPPRPTLADLARKTKMEDSRESSKEKPREATTQVTESKPSPVSTAPQPQTLSVANIAIHNAKTRDTPLKWTKPKKEKGGKKVEDGRANASGGK